MLHHFYKAWVWKPLHTLGSRNFNLLQMSIGAMLAMLFVTTRDYFVFGFALYGNLMPAILLVRIISSIIFGAALTIAIGNALAATGVLSGFRISSRENEC